MCEIDSSHALSGHFAYWSHQNPTPTSRSQSNAALLARHHHLLRWTDSRSVGIRHGLTHPGGFYRPRISSTPVRSSKQSALSFHQRKRAGEGSKPAEPYRVKSTIPTRVGRNPHQGRSESPPGSVGS